VSLAHVSLALAGVIRGRLRGSSATSSKFFRNAKRSEFTGATLVRAPRGGAHLGGDLIRSSRGDKVPSEGRGNRLAPSPDGCF